MRRSSIDRDAVRRSGDFTGSGGGGGGGGTSTAAIVTLDSIHTVGLRLDAFNTTLYAKGSLAYVGNDTFAGQGSVHRYYTLVYGENLTADGIEVVNSPTFGIDGAQWLSQDTMNQQFLQKNFWAIDPVNGNDENTGWGVSQAAAIAVPLKTMRELNRRMFGYRAGDPTMALTPQFNVLSSIPAADSAIMTNISGYNGNGQPYFQGLKTQVGGNFIVTAYATAVSAANTGYLLSAVGLGTAVAAVIAGGARAMIQNAAGTKTAWTLEVIGADQIRVNNPTNADLVAATVANAVFVVAETVRIFTLPVIPNWPFGPSTLFTGCQDLEIQGGFAANGTFDFTLFGNSQPQIFRCLLNGMNISGGGEGFIISCLFAKHQTSLSSCQCVFRSCAIDGVVAFVLDGGVTIFEFALDISGPAAQLRVGQIARVGLNIGTLVSVFNTTTAAILASPECSFVMALASTGTTLYGKGNTGIIVQTTAMSRLRLPKANCTAVTTAVAPLQVVGVNHPYADIPIIDTTNQAFIIE